MTRNHVQLLNPFLTTATMKQSLPVFVSALLALTVLLSPTRSLTVEKPTVTDPHADSLLPTLPNLVPLSQQDELNRLLAVHRLKTGQMVRIWTHRHLLEGRFLRSQNQSIIVQRNENESTIEISQVQALWVHSRQTGKGALIGSVVGATTGLFLGLFHSGSTNACDQDCPGLSPYFAFLGALGGSALGANIGSATGRWKAVFFSPSVDFSRDTLLEIPHLHADRFLSNASPVGSGRLFVGFGRSTRAGVPGSMGLKAGFLAHLGRYFAVGPEIGAVDLNSVKETPGVSVFHTDLMLRMTPIRKYQWRPFATGSLGYYVWDRGISFADGLLGGSLGMGTQYLWREGRYGLEIEARFHSTLQNAPNQRESDYRFGVIMVGGLVNW